MALLQSFSTTAECPILEQSASTLTVRLSNSCSGTPVTTSTSRFVSFSELEGPSRPRAQTESIAPTRISSPPPTSHSRGKIASGRVSHSGSFSSLIMSVCARSKSKTTASSSERKCEMETSMSWFERARDFVRPWDDDGDQKIDSDWAAVPEEQKQAFAQTQNVSSSAYRVCDPKLTEPTGGS